MICPITYGETTERYSPEALRLFSPRTRSLRDFPYSAADQLREAALRASKISIQGVQPKLSCTFSVARGVFEIVDCGGTYIMKPQHPQYPELPENEDLSMRLAAKAGIEVPFHGLIYCTDGTRTYFIKRFDRLPRGKKLAVEDFSQLTDQTRETKYSSSMERVAETVERFCTFPAVAKPALFRRMLVAFLIGNEDMHLKNFSVLTDAGVTALSPAYDMVNTTIALSAAAEETALPIFGKKSKLTREIFFMYFARERLRLQPEIIAMIALELTTALDTTWPHLIENSFLSQGMKSRYRTVVAERRERLGL